MSLWSPFLAHRVDMDRNYVTVTVCIACLRAFRVRSVPAYGGSEEVEPSTEGVAGNRRLAGRVSAVRGRGRERQDPANVRRQRGQLPASARLRRTRRRLGVPGFARQRARTQGAVHSAAQGSPLICVTSYWCSTATSGQRARAQSSPYSAAYDKGKR